MENKWTRIEAIRKALADRPAILRTHWEGCETEARHADCAIAFLLDEIERRDAALRALVEQMDADSAKAQESAKAATDIVASAGWIARSTALFTSARDVSRLLEHEP